MTNLDRTLLPAFQVFNAATADATSQGFAVEACRHVNFDVQNSAGTPSFVILVKGSFMNVEDVDFSSSPSATNRWAYVAFRDYGDASTFYVGSTGYTQNSPETKLFEINTNHLRSVAFEIDSYGAGSVNLFLYGATNT